MTAGNQSEDAPSTASNVSSPELGPTRKQASGLTSIMTTLGSGAALGAVAAAVAPIVPVVAAGAALGLVAGYVANRLEAGARPWNLEAATDRALDAIRQNRGHGSKVDAVINDFRRKAREACVSPDLSYPDCLRYFALRLVEDDPGRAPEVIQEAANIYAENRQTEAAAKAYRDLAHALYDRGILGLAGQRFYYAAAVYLAQAELDKALQVLREANGRIWNPSDTPWVAWLPRHVSILEDETLSPSEKIETLKSHFGAEQQNSLVESCNDGLRKLGL